MVKEERMDFLRKLFLWLAVFGLPAGGSVFGVVGFSLVPTPASAATIRSCVSADLRVTLGTAQGAAGTIYHPIVFTNVSSTPCSMFGVPVIQPVRGADHKDVGPLARNTSMGEMPALHTLSSGRSVSVAFGVTETGNYTPSACVARAADGVLVSIGNFLHSHFVHLPISVCAKRASTTTKLLTPGSKGY